MPNFNSQADIYCAVGPSVPKYQPIPQKRPAYSGTIVQCREWFMKNHQGYPALYSMVIPLEAGFQKTQLDYREIEELSNHPQFPK